MALQTFANQHELYGYSNKDLYNLLQGSWSYDYDLQGNFEKDSLENLEEKTTDEEHSATYNQMGAPELDQWGRYAGASELEISCTNVPQDEFPVTDSGTTMSTRSRRRRSRTKKNQEEIENQRMAHIAVERNRRKQMNEYLSLLRGLMPDYYVLKADQASVIGGAINYVKELEQQLQFLGSLNHANRNYEAGSSSSPFSEFFTFPQYSTGCENFMATSDLMYDPFMGQKRYAAADIEVTMVENHANLKVRSKRRPKQLLKIVSGLQNLRLSVLHLNVTTTVDQVVLYSLSLKVEDDCNLSSVDDIAAAVNQILSRIQEEAWLI